ncbi:MAG: putative bifunctional diguanylate cyclase/phosphodiesterase [Gammaproteobacteria bacterium]
MTTRPTTDGTLEVAAASKSAGADPKIMIVDDASMTIRILQTFLEDAGYRRFVTTSDSTQAIELVESERPDALLLDLHMPSVSGFDILEQIRASFDIRHTPVIILTASDDGNSKLKALELGATDFLAKPVDTSELALRLRNTLATKTYQDRLTYYDPLTDLPNRKLHSERLSRSLVRAFRSRQRGAMLHINLDRFRRVNSSLGHAAGDHLLRHTAQRLDRIVRQLDNSVSLSMEPGTPTAARLGGDEFGVLLPTVESNDAARAIAEQILGAITKPVEWKGSEVVVTASIGVETFPDSATTTQQIIRNVTLAAARARSLGRNRHEVYSPLSEASVSQEVHLESDLHRALSRNELRLHYQPKVDLATGNIGSAEALLRWEHKTRGLVSPSEFIPLAEQTGLIVPFGTWVIQTACAQIRQWCDDGLPPLPVAVNVSSLQFANGDLLSIVADAITTAGIAPALLILELTETAVLKNTEETISTLHAIRSLGVKLSLDDFGTGYSSLSYLERLPIDQLKIDRSFVEKIEDGNTAPIVDAVIAMAKSLGMHTVAEGVEEPCQVDYLKARHCDQYQGFYFSRAVDPVSFGNLVAEQMKRERPQVSTAQAR